MTEYLENQHNCFIHRSVLKATGFNLFSHGPFNIHVQDRSGTSKRVLKMQIVIGKICSRLIVAEVVKVLALHDLRLVVPAATSEVFVVLGQLCWRGLHQGATSRYDHLLTRGTSTSDIRQKKNILIITTGFICKQQQEGSIEKYYDDNNYKIKTSNNYDWPLSCTVLIWKLQNIQSGKRWNFKLLNSWNYNLILINAEYILIIFSELKYSTS